MCPCGAARLDSMSKGLFLSYLCPPVTCELGLLVKDFHVQQRFAFPSDLRCPLVNLCVSLSSCVHLNSFCAVAELRFPEGRGISVKE